jgi:triacylglycerol lipase
MEIRDRIRAFGDTESLEAYDGALAAYVPLHEREPYAAIRIERDLAYGDDPRQRLNVFVPDDRGDAGLPVLVFAHGGGFVRGDKQMPNAPYYDNAGVWAARNGFIGITINYRLAPAHTWPAAADDIARVVAWIAANAATYSGDAARVFLMGHSAGATHIASYIARRDSGTYGAFELRGAILISGIYDLAVADASAGLVAYFGEDAGERTARSSLTGLAQTATRLLVVNAEFDARAFHEQGVALQSARFAQTGRLPLGACLPDHGHLSEIAQLNAVDDLLARAILAFTAA